MSSHLKKYGIFASGSAMGAVVDYAITMLAAKFLGMSPELALGLAMLFSATAVFFWHDHITFKSAGQSRLARKYLAFMLWSVLVYLLRAVLLVGFGMVGLPLSIALALSIGLASVVNYILSSRAIFRTQKG
ncbi:GtrA family protein [Paracoccus aestuariivivens]|nr:GtrA family protein [Paracoccus aestuariivivens]